MKRTFNDYTVLELLGSGGLADVYHARDPTGREVALKVLRESKRSQPHRRRFTREGYLLQKFAVLGLPHCYEVIEEPIPCLALEYTPGRTLAEHLAAGGPLAPEVVEDVARQVLATLGFLHARGVVHRDVKASNIFLCNEGRALLIDLGLAVDPDDPFTTTLGDVLGTYAYMAPEQIAGAGSDARSDLYSLGITLYEALAGRRPFQARGMTGYLHAHRSGQARPLGEIVKDASGALLDLVYRLMARDPSARPPSAGVALALLTGHLPSPGELRPPPLVGRSGASGAIQAILDQGGVLHVVGETGHGIGRIARLALELAHQSGVEVLAVRCRLGGLQNRLVPQIVRGLAFLLAEEVETTEDGIVEVFEQLVAEGPFLLLLEDVNLAAPDDLAAVARIVTSVKGLCVVTTSLGPLPGFRGRTLVLRTLQPEEIAALAAGMLGTSTPPAELTSLLLRETGGLPALVVLVIRDMHTEGILHTEGFNEDGEPRWTLDLPARQAQSRRLSGAIQRVVGNLPAEARRILEVLAVAGEAIPVGLAIAAAGVDASGIDVHRLLALGLVTLTREGEEEWVEVRRPILAALLRRDIGSAGRRGVHRALALALESWDPSDWRDRALHLYRVLGSPEEDVSEPLLELGSRALADGEMHRVAEILEKLLASNFSDPSVPARAGILRGRWHLALGRWEEARTAFNAARSITREASLRSVLAEAVVGIATAHLQSGASFEAEALATEAASHARPEDGGVRARVAWIRGCAADWRGDEASALPLFAEAERLAATTDDAEAMALARAAQAACHAERGRYAQAAACCLEAMECFRGRPSNPVSCTSLIDLAAIRCREGAFREGLALLDEAEWRAAGPLDRPYLEARSGVIRASIHLEAGDLQGAAHLLRRHRAAREPRSDVHSRLAYHLVNGEVRMATEDLQSALAAFDEAGEIARKMGFAAVVAWCRGIGAVLTATADPLAASLEVLQRTGSRRRMAALLQAGAHVVGDVGTLKAAADEARSAQDVPLLLRILHGYGGPDVQIEAVALARRILDQAGPVLARHVRALPEIRWALGD
ncbi:MAG: protein kinase [Deltaproteobacteria bacterium]|nr:protein kinase [Deltaproteobacteria bacterium]